MRLFPAAAAVEANSASLDPKTTEEAEAVSEAVAPPDDEVITGEDETLGNWTTLSVVVLPVEVASEVVVVCTNKSASITISNLRLPVSHFSLSQIHSVKEFAEIAATMSSEKSLVGLLTKLDEILHLYL